MLKCTELLFLLCLSKVGYVDIYVLLWSSKVSWQDNQQRFYPCSIVDTNSGCWRLYSHYHLICSYLNFSLYRSSGKYFIMSMRISAFVLKLIYAFLLYQEICYLSGSWKVKKNPTKMPLCPKHFEYVLSIFLLFPSLSNKYIKRERTKPFCCGTIT